MASNLDDPSSWRLSWIGGTVPVKILNTTADFEFESGSVVLSVLVPANRVVDFLVETFPPTAVVGGLPFPNGVFLPGLPGLIARRVSIKNQNDSKPCDPFGLDPTAPDGTYYPAVVVDVEFGPRPNTQPNPNDPRTFLEISASAGGEFINSTAPGAKWQKKQNSADDTQPPSDQNPRPGAEETTKEPVRDPTAPIIVRLPTIDWTVKWNQIPYEQFRDVVIHRLRWGIGRINSVAMPIFFDAPAETILFEGYNYTQVYTWRDGFVNIPPINVEMKFAEKNVVWDGVQRGHNDFWRPGVGWETILIDGISKKVYEQRNLNLMFSI